MKLRILFALLACVPFARAQAPKPAEPAKSLTFEVASIKRADPATAGQAGGIRPMPGGETYVATNVPLRLMIS